MRPEPIEKKFRRAILVTGSPLDEGDQAPLAMERALHLVPFIGKTPLVHVLESMVTLGVEHVTVLGWLNPDVAREILGEGQRWGISLDWITVQGPEEIFRKIAQLPMPADELVLVGSTNSLLDLRSASRPSSSCAYGLTLPGQAWPWLALDETNIRRIGNCHWHNWSDVPKQLQLPQFAVPGVSLQSGQDLLAAISPMLMGELPVVVPASQIEPGIYISRNVVIHPTVVIQGPVYIGEDVYLEQGARVHAGSVIGKQCRIGQNTTISNSIIGPESWLGAHLECAQMVIWRGVAWSSRWNAEIEIRDAVLLSSGTWHLTLRRTLTEGMSFLSAALLLVLTLPVLVPMLLLAMLKNDLKFLPFVLPKRAHLHDPTQNILCLFGAGPSARGWKHLLGFVLPNLHWVLRGQLHLTGMRLRTPSEWKASPIDVQKWLSRRSAGLVQEEWFNGPHKGDWLESIVQDRYQVARGRSLRYQAHLLWRYFLKLTTGSREPATR
jgi:hypothetical protein